MTESTNTDHSLHSLGRGSLIFLIGQIVLIGTTFGSRVLIFRSLSTTDFGDITLGVATVAIIGPVATLGIPFGIARQLAHAKSPQEKHHLIQAAIATVVPMSVLTGLALYLAAPAMSAFINNPSMTVVLQFFSIYLPVTMVTGTLGAVFQGDEDMLPLTLFNMIVTPALLLAFIMFFFVRGDNLGLVLWSYVLSSTGGLIGITLYTLNARRRHSTALDGGSQHGAGQSSAFKDLLLFSLPLTMMGVATIATGNVDSLILGYLGPTTQTLDRASIVGTYGAVITVSKLLTLGVGSFSAILLPVAARLHKSGNTEELRKSYATMTKWLLAIFVPIYIILMILPSPSLLLIYGPKTLSSAYVSGPLVLRITATGAILSVLLGPAQSVLTGFGRLRILFYDTIASALIDIVGSLILIPAYGITGAAVAFAASTAALPILAVAQTSLLYNVHPFTSEAMKPFAAFTVIASALLLLPVLLLVWSPSWTAMIALFFIFLGLYLAIILYTRSTEREDLYLLSVLEEYLGRPLPLLRRIVIRFVRDDASRHKGL